MSKTSKPQKPVASIWMHVDERGIPNDYAEVFATRADVVKFAAGSRYERFHIVPVPRARKVRKETAK